MRAYDRKAGLRIKYLALNATNAHKLRFSINNIFIHEVTMNFASNAERKASEVLFPLGFVLSNDKAFPRHFKDKNGEVFQAMPDFFHPELGIYVEVKDRSLNDKGSRSEARNACANASDWFKRKHPCLHQIRNQWSNSAEKVAITQQALGAENLIVVFVRSLEAGGTREKETWQLIEEKGIIACDLKYFPRMYYGAKLIKLLQKGQ
jgi:hypothetical protein